MQIETLYNLFRSSTGISTDTRSVEYGNLFFALKGENFNGNLFAEKAIESGASYAIADEKIFVRNEKIIVVENVLETLHQLANFHRKNFQAKVIAIGGSNGKTTTKELISRVLEMKFKTFFTKGNLNNHIGVPLSLLSINDEIEFAVIEMGANHLGETNLLCEIAEPDFGLITNNGKDHLEGYGSIEGVRKGNGELFDFLRSKNRLAFVCADQTDLMEMSGNINRITYGTSAKANFTGEIISQFPFLKIKSQGINIESHLIGKYNFENIMAAICVGKHFGIEDDQIKMAIERYQPTNNRSQVLERDGNTFILDAYNANPSSMNAALENFYSLPEKNKIVILGDMAELGSSSTAEHQLIVDDLKSQRIEKIILVGSEFKKVFPMDKNFLHFENVNALKAWFQNQSFRNYFFLLKASRVIKLEQLLS